MNTLRQSRNQKGGQLSSFEDEKEDEDESLRRPRKLSWIAVQMHTDKAD